MITKSKKLNLGIIETAIPKISKIFTYIDLTFIARLMHIHIHGKRELNSAAFLIVVAM